MKVAIVLFAFLAIAYAEMCRDNSGCVNHGITNCGSGYHVVCDNNQCVCTDGPTDKVCSGRDDCGDCHHGQKPHCIDGKCHCTRF